MLCPKTYQPSASDGFTPNSTITWRNRVSLYYRTTLTRKERKEGKKGNRKEGRKERGRKEERERTKGRKERQKETTTNHKVCEE